MVEKIIVKREINSEISEESRDKANLMLDKFNLFVEKISKLSPETNIVVAKPQDSYMISSLS